jgi:hypothetical protein
MYALKQPGRPSVTRTILRLIVALSRMHMGGVAEAEYPNMHVKACIYTSALGFNHLHSLLAC